MSGSYNDNNKSFSGKGQSAIGNWFEWNMVKMIEPTSEIKIETKNNVNEKIQCYWRYSVSIYCLRKKRDYRKYQNPV